MDEPRQWVGNCSRPFRFGLLAGVSIGLLLSFCAQASAAPKATHVVVVVFDGLRPDSVTPTDMPTLYALSQKGTSFARHHAVYLSTTEVNGTALATGSLPWRSGIMANNEYRPDLELLKPIGTQELGPVQKGDAKTGGAYLRMPTVAEIVRKAGQRTVVAGTKPVALLLDRSDREAGELDKQSISLFSGRTLPQNAAAEIQQAEGDLPEIADATQSANRSQDTWTTRVLINRLWAGQIPAFTTLWLSEPDFAQHGSGPGSEVARAALKSDDDNLASVLAALDRADARDSTDILIVSDHGFSTIERTIDATRLLRQAGFDAHNHFQAEPSCGQIMVVANGGSICCYVVGHSQPVARRLVDFFQASDFTGVVFTRTAMGGTLTLDQVGINTPDAPDVVVSMRWNDATSDTGMPGLLASSATKFRAGQGYHGSLSRFDMHNTLIASGPDFRQRFVSELPSGNIDIAPTVLWLLSLKPPVPMDGRVLHEALCEHDDSSLTPETETLRTERQKGHIHWREYLKITRVGSAIYFDEGNVDTSAGKSQQN